MADISVTAASVVAPSNARLLRGIAGEALSAGQVIAKNASNRIVKADANAVDGEDPDTYLRNCKGIAVTSAAANQPVFYMNEGSLTFNAALTAGVVYVLSGTAGGIAPVADLASGMDVVILGVASSTTVLDIHIFSSGIEKP